MPSSYHERHLPHWQPEDAALFITWRLHGSMPNKPDIIGVPRQRLAGQEARPTSGKVFAAFDRELANAAGPRWLEDTRVAQCVTDTLLFGQRGLKLYELWAWVIMPNHVHILVYPAVDLDRITRSIKSFSARRANDILGRTGQPFWQNESYDHWARNEIEVGRIVRYIEFNPVSAGFVESPELWRWSSAWAGQEARPTGISYA